MLFNVHVCLWPRVHGYNSLYRRFSELSKINVNNYQEKLSYLMHTYENIIGLSEVKEAQEKVLQKEQKFIDAQEERRQKQSRMLQIQKRLKEIHSELEKTHRGEDRYLALVMQEHNILKEERSLFQEYEQIERKERDYFMELSNAVRDSHEKERAHANRTKYWSVIGSVCGAIIGITGSAISNYLRMKELKKMIKQTEINPEALNIIKNEICDKIQKQQELNSTTMSLPFDGNNNRKSTNLKESTIQFFKPEWISDVQSSMDSLKSDLSEVKQLITHHNPISLHYTASADSMPAIILNESIETKQNLLLLSSGVILFAIFPLLFKAFWGV